MKCLLSTGKQVKLYNYKHMNIARLKYFKYVMLHTCIAIDYFKYVLYIYVTHTLTIH